VFSQGYSLLEVLMAIAVSVIVCGAAVPLAHGSVDRTRTAGAARYVAGRLAAARFEAVKRSAHVAVRFVDAGDGYLMRTYVDGNGNGVLTRDIARALDTPITLEERLDAQFSNVTFGILPDVTSLDPGEPFNADDPIQIGASTLLSFSPTGACTSGTLFIRGLRGTQFAVRVLGATARTRVFEFNFGDKTWRTR
jgi:prepilin-type N-terminal cleavage/methylation domain-containing protein